MFWQFLTYPLPISPHSLLIDSLLSGMESGDDACLAVQRSAEGVETFGDISQYELQEMLEPSTNFRTDLSRSHPQTLPLSGRDCYCRMLTERSGGVLVWDRQLAEAKKDPGSHCSGQDAESAGFMMSGAGVEHCGLGILPWIIGLVRNACSRRDFFQFLPSLEVALCWFSWWSCASEGSNTDWCVKSMWALAANGFGMRMIARLS